mmetsp:Transcript_18166/g.52461  ORF Transcript_18166/g.52461 Transcript_18166/m.52461 type:complete len:306 (+) Transcript_18166:423-1340(+)
MNCCMSTPSAADQPWIAQSLRYSAAQASSPAAKPHNQAKKCNCLERNRPAPLASMARKTLATMSVLRSATAPAGASSATARPVAPKADARLTWWLPRNFLCSCCFKARRSPSLSRCLRRFRNASLYKWFTERRGDELFVLAGRADCAWAAANISSRLFSSLAWRSVCWSKSLFALMSRRIFISWPAFSGALSSAPAASASASPPSSAACASGLLCSASAPSAALPLSSLPACSAGASGASSPSVLGACATDCLATAAEALALAAARPERTGADRVPQGFLAPSTGLSPGASDSLAAASRLWLFTK